MYTKKISLLSDEELFYVGGGSSKKDLIALGLSDDDCVVLMPNAYEEFIKAGKEITPEIEKSIYDIIQNYEQALTPGSTLGTLNGDGSNAHFLSLKMTLVSHWFHEITLPTIINVGVCIDTLLSSGSGGEKETFLWVRDCYYQFLKNYFVSCKELPLNILMDVERGYDPQNEDNVIEHTTKLLEWYENKYGKSFVNTQEGIDPKECVVQIVRDLFTQWSNETYYGNSKEHPCCVKFEPMTYGNKDIHSGSGIIEIFPNTMIKESFSVSATTYRGRFYPKMINVKSDKDWNESYQTSDEFEIVFPDEQDSWYAKAATQQLKISSLKIVEAEMEKLSLFGDKDTIQRIADDTAGIRVFYVVESGKLVILNYGFIPKQEYIEEAKKRLEIARAEDEKQKIEKMQNNEEKSQIDTRAESAKKGDTSDLRELLVMYFPDFNKVSEIKLKDGATTEEMSAHLDEYTAALSRHEAEEKLCGEKLKNSLIEIMSFVFSEKGLQIWQDDKVALNILGDVTPNKELENALLKAILNSVKAKKIVQELFDNGNIITSFSSEEIFSEDGTIKEITSAMFTALQEIWSYSAATVAVIDAFLYIAKMFSTNSVNEGNDFVEHTGLIEFDPSDIDF